MSNQFTHKTIEQLANQAINGENAIELEIATTLEDEDKVKPIRSIGVEVDAYSDLRPFLDDAVVISLLLKDGVGFLVSYFNMEIEEAEKLGELLLFQCKVARMAREKKRLLLKQIEQKTAK